MPEEPNQPNYPYLYYAAGYSADIVRSKFIPESNEREAMWRLMIRPHFSLRHYCGSIIDKIPIDDKKRRWGDYLIVEYPLRLRKTENDDPTHTVYRICCDFEGHEIHNIGLPDEEFAEQLRNAQNRILSLKMELAQKEKIMSDLVEKRDIIEEMTRKVRETISQEMRLFQTKEKGKNE